METSNIFQLWLQSHVLHSIRKKIFHPTRTIRGPTRQINLRCLMQKYLKCKGNIASTKKLGIRIVQFISSIWSLHISFHSSSSHDTTLLSRYYSMSFFFSLLSFKYSFGKFHSNCKYHLNPFPSFYISLFHEDVEAFQLGGSIHLVFTCI